MLFVAVGIALSILSNLGTSSLSTPAYVMNDTFGLSIGNWTIIINMSYLIIQLLVLRSRFKVKYLMQIPATMLLGYLIDLSVLCFQWIEPDTLFFRLVLIIIACLATAIGVSIEVIAQGWMLPAEMTVYAIMITTHKPFNKIKIAMDCILVLISIAMAWIMYRNPFGFGPYEGLTGVVTGTSPGVVIGLGTVIMAVLVGLMMKLTDPVTNKLFDWLFDILIYKN